MALKDAFKLDTSPKKVQLAMLFIMGGALLRIALAEYPNIEPVIALAMLAGIILGGLWAFIVPMGIMAISDWAINVLHYETTYGWGNLLGISLFTWSGMIAIGLISTRFRPIFLFKWKKFAVFTGVGKLPAADTVEHYDGRTGHRLRSFCAMPSCGRMLSISPRRRPERRLFPASSPHCCHRNSAD